jgi:hypothetical protein
MISAQRAGRRRAALLLWSVAVNGMPIQEGGESLRNCVWTLKLQEVAGALNGAVFHMREPRMQQRGDLYP